MVPVALTIAGSDPSGGAGIQADLKTFHRFGVYGEAVITLVTAQNTLGVYDLVILDPDIVWKQIEAVTADIPPHAAKTGALGNASIVRMVSDLAWKFSFPLVVDPVMISKHGAKLLDDEAVRAMRDELLPRAYVVTPNLAEAALLTGHQVSTIEEMRQAARKLGTMGAGAALVKGGHLDGARAIDVLCIGGELYEFVEERIESRHTHGTGCTLSAAIVAQLAMGKSLLDAVQEAKAFITHAIRTSPRLGGGNGPVNHWAL